MPTIGDEIETHVEHYLEHGYAASLRALEPDAMAAVRARIEREVLTSDGPNTRNRSPLHCRHLDHAFLRELCRAPAIVAAARRLIGDDLQVWSTNFWNKEPGASAVPWHQDINYWPLNPPINLTAWVAIDDVDETNSCVQVIPDSHRQQFEHVAVADQMLGEEARFAADELPAPVPLVLRAGEFALFNERCLHHSASNRSDRRRLGFGIRIIPAFVQVHHDELPLFPGHRCLRLCGEDPFGRNRVAQT